MSKIICDVCGSSYSETATQCPICGTARSDAAKPAAEPVVEEQAPKGGKFSRSNNAKPAPGGKKPAPNKDGKGKDEPASNLPMIIIVTVLLLAIVAVCVFIAVRFMGNPEPDTTGSSQASQPTDPPVLNVPCTGIELLNNDTRTISFSAATDSYMLQVRALPENTTENVTYTYTSSNPAIVLVDQTGRVTPVANGTAIVTVAYGDYSIPVDVTVELPVVLTELKLKSNDITLSPTYGLTYDLFGTVNGELKASDVEWKSSDDAIVTVKDGVVTAVKNGKVTITATYGDLTATCKVIVSNMTVETEYVIVNQWGDTSDATMKVGEELKIWVKNKTTGEIVKDLEWGTSKDFSKCCTYVKTENGVKVTATATTANVSGQYVYIYAKDSEGVQYKFIIRVKATQTEG